MNDQERTLWIQNDEGLYSWWKSSGLSLTQFIRENRADLTTIIDKATGKEPDND